ncbi:hypothetical protein DXT74_12090 [Chromobacterium sp. Rain0013]|nr:hypothetical protein DXT74_12090 [Chromobacterium sp. Rain0013]
MGLNVIYGKAEDLFSPSLAASALGLRHFHAVKLTALVVERRIGDTVLTLQLSYWEAGLGFLKDGNDLCSGISSLPHERLL